jgi:hypothetical protein
MAITLPLQHILELTFNVLTAAVGIVVIILGLRIASKLTLSTHRRALWISFGAVALIVASNMATVWANFSRRRSPVGYGTQMAAVPSPYGTASPRRYLAPTQPQIRASSESS